MKISSERLKQLEASEAFASLNDIESIERASSLEQSSHEDCKKWIAKAGKYIKQLEHYRDTTRGLWATDRPDLIYDPKKLLFRIT
jgi:hypothetical protein